MSETFAIGDLVIYIGNQRYSSFYPKTGTIGTIVEVCDDGTSYVKWPEGSIGFTDSHSYIANSCLKRRITNE